MFFYCNAVYYSFLSLPNISSFYCLSLIICLPFPLFISFFIYLSISTGIHFLGFDEKRIRKFSQLIKVSTTHYLFVNLIKVGLILRVISYILLTSTWIPDFDSLFLTRLITQYSFLIQPFLSFITQRIRYRWIQYFFLKMHRSTTDKPIRLRIITYTCTQSIFELK